MLFFRREDKFDINTGYRNHELSVTRSFPRQCDFFDIVDDLFHTIVLLPISSLLNCYDRNTNEHQQFHYLQKIEQILFIEKTA